ncbi:MAG TPA: tetratricopeptide repeat protein [Drouetiella sp.]|jgi:Tetratricopeptide repeat
MTTSIHDIPILELQQMALDAQASGNISQAKSIYICLIAAIKTKDGPKSERLAANFFQLAEVYGEENNYVGAQTLYERAIEIWKLSPNPEASKNIKEATKRLHILSELESGRALREERKNRGTTSSDRQDVA